MASVAVWLCPDVRLWNSNTRATRMYCATQGTQPIFCNNHKWKVMFKHCIKEASLVVQWLGLWASPAGSKGLIPGQGTKILHAVRSGKKHVGGGNCQSWGWANVHQTGSSRRHLSVVTQSTERSTWSISTFGPAGGPDHKHEIHLTQCSKWSENTRLT